jgi:cystine transport system substrate-binding protein
MKRFYLLFVIAWLAATVSQSALAEETLDVAKRTGIIRVGTGVMGLKPYLWKDESGNLTGAEYEVYSYIADKIGVKAEWIVAEWTALIPGLNANQWDMLGTSSASEERAIGGGIVYSRPWGVIYDRVIVLKGSPIKGVDDLKDKTVATVLGTVDSVTAHALKDQGKIKEVKDFSGWGEPFLALQNKQVDAVIIDEQEGLARQKDMPEIELVGDPIFFIPKPEFADAQAKAEYTFGALAIGLRKSDPKLREAINSAIDAMDEDGTRQKILEKYGMWNNYQKKENLFQSR